MSEFGSRRNRKVVGCRGKEGVWWESGRDVEAEYGGRDLWFFDTRDGEEESEGT